MDCPSLSPAMEQEDFNTFLTEAYLVENNPFSVEGMYSGSRCAVRWPMIQRTLKLTDTQATQLVACLQKSAKAPKLMPPPKPRAEVDPVVRSRLEALGKVGTGKAATIYGQDDDGKFLDKDGNPMKVASGWDQLLQRQPGGRMDAYGMMKSKSGGAFTATATAQQSTKEKEAASKAEAVALPPSTLRVPMPPTGWNMRPDIAFAYNNQSVITDFLSAGIELPAIDVREGIDSGGRKYMEIVNLTVPRKDKLTHQHEQLSFKATRGGTMAVLAAISKLAEHQDKKHQDNARDQVNAMLCCAMSRVPSDIPSAIPFAIRPSATSATCTLRSVRLTRRTHNKWRRLRRQLWLRKAH